jgi:hypothetical protein
MTPLTDELLRRRLADRAVTVPPASVAPIARSVTAERQRHARALPVRWPMLGSAAAVAVVIVAVVAGLVSRAAPPSTGTQTAPIAIDATPSSSAGSAGASELPIASEPPIQPAAVWSSIAWQPVPATAFQFDQNTFVTDAIGNGDGFVAVGYTLAKRTNVGRIWLSPDGRSWRLVEPSPIGNLRADRIVRVGNELVLLGTRLAALMVDGPTEVWRSTNGTTWTQGPTAPASTRFVAAGSDGILAAGRDTVMVLGPDLASWTTAKRAVADDVLLGTPSGGEGLWIQPGATGMGDAGAVSTGAIFISRDGVTWARATITDPGGVVNRVFRVDRGWVAVGSDRNIGCRVCFGPIVLTTAAWFSDDGQTWTRIPIPGSPEDSPIFGASFVGDGHRLIAIRSGRVEAVGGSGETPMSLTETVDGLTWTAIAVEPSEPRPAELSGPLIVGSTGLASLSDAVLPATEPQAWWAQAAEVPLAPPR